MNISFDKERYLREAADPDYVEGAELGDIDCVCMLAMDYAREDGKKAVDLLERFADNPNATLHFNIGMAYYDGIGREKDLKKAAEHFQISADGGDEDGQFMLAECYRNGWGVKEDLGKAEQLFFLSAEQGEMDALSRIADIYLDTDYEAGTEQLDHLLELALYHLGKADQAYMAEELGEVQIDQAGELHEQLAWIYLYMGEAVGEDSGEGGREYLQNAFDHFCMALFYGRNSAVYYVANMYFTEDYASACLKYSDEELLELLEDEESESEYCDIARLLSDIYKNNIHGFGDGERADFWERRARNKATPEQQNC